MRAAGSQTRVAAREVRTSTRVVTSNVRQWSGLALSANKRRVSGSARLADAMPAERRKSRRFIRATFRFVTELFSCPRRRRLLCFLFMNRHGSRRNCGKFAVRFNAPAFSHTVATRRQAKKCGQLDDFRIAVVFLQLFIYLRVPAIVECESPGEVESSTRLRIRMLPVRQRAARFLFLGD